MLGPVLIVSHSSIDIFADDITLSARAHWTDIRSKVRDINCDLEGINDWLAQNKMIINTDGKQAY